MTLVFIRDFFLVICKKNASIFSKIQSCFFYNYRFSLICSVQVNLEASGIFGFSTLALALHTSIGSDKNVFRPNKKNTRV